MPDKQEIPIARYDMIAVTCCVQREPEGDWMRYEDHLAAISTLAHQLSQAKAEHGKTLELLRKAAFETIPALEARLARLGLRT